MTIARKILDERLNELKHLIKAPVLDVGGEKELGIGTFRPPDGIKWYYVNIDSRYKPDVSADCYNLAFLNDTFSTVMICELLEHLKNPGKALDEAYRVLRPGGRLFLSMPFLYRHHQNPRDYQRWTHEKIYEELNINRGFEIEVFLPRGAWLATMLDIFTQGASSFVPGAFFGSRALNIMGRFMTWSIKKSYPAWSRVDHYLSREDKTKGIFHRFTTGYIVVARKTDRKKGEGMACAETPDALCFPSTRTAT